MQRKPVAMLLAVLMALSLVLTACGGTAPTAQPTPAAEPAPQPAAAEVDEEAIIRAAVVKYYKNLDANNLYKIEPAAFWEQYQASPGMFQVVDIRSPEDFAKGHIEGAINIPFKEVANNLDKFDKNKKVVVTCYTGQTAGQTVACLNLLGIKAWSLAGGMSNGWDKEGLPKVQ